MGTVRLGNGGALMEDGKGGEEQRGDWRREMSGSGRPRNSVAGVKKGVGDTSGWGGGRGMGLSKPKNSLAKSRKGP